MSKNLMPTSWESQLETVEPLKVSGRETKQRNARKFSDISFKDMKDARIAMASWQGFWNVWNHLNEMFSKEYKIPQ